MDFNNCNYCGKPFVKKRNQMFCGVVCSNKSPSHRKIKGITKNKNCEICNTEFYASPALIKRGGGQTCSYKCRWDRKKKQLEPINIERNKQKEKIKNEKNKVIEDLKLIKNKCKVCDKQKVGLSKFCSNECKIKDKPKSTKIKKQCLNCGKDIFVVNAVSLYGYGKFCSSSCSSIMRIKNHKSHFVNSVGGKREDLNNVYFRSTWEANYARYLNFLIKNGEVIKWEFEPETFIFDKIKKGTKSYLPDFKVYYTKNPDKPIYIEIKGYMDARSKTKIERMKRYFPNIELRVIEGKEYRQLANQVKDIIPNWEIRKNGL